MRPPTEESPKDLAQLCGYNAEGFVVYSESLDRGEYWDGEHVWDSYDRIRALGMVKLIGKLYDENGLLYQEFESVYSPSGELVGGKESWADGTKNAFGVLADA
jgi:hypothetical protein